MSDPVYISRDDIDNWMDAYACGNNPLADRINRIPASDIDGPGVYDCFNENWEKIS